MIIGRRARRGVLAVVVGVGLAAGLVGCGRTGPDLSMTDPWVRATEEAMTGAFGTIVNDSGADARIVAASSPVAGRVELHTTATGDDGEPVMREKEDGFLVPAHGAYELAPGGDHVMLMELGEPVRPGDEVALVLTTADGDSLEVTAQARTFAGGMEEYQPSDGG